MIKFVYVNFMGMTRVEVYNSLIECSTRLRGLAFDGCTPEFLELEGDTYCLEELDCHTNFDVAAFVDNLETVHTHSLESPPWFDKEQWIMLIKEKIIGDEKTLRAVAENVFANVDNYEEDVTGIEGRIQKLLSTFEETGKVYGKLTLCK